MFVHGLLDVKILTFPIPIFAPIYHPSVYQFRTKKPPNFVQIRSFYDNLLKIHPIYVNWVPSSAMKTPPIAIPKFATTHPKRQAHIRIPCQCENPLRAIDSTRSTICHNQMGSLGCYFLSVCFCVGWVCSFYRNYWSLNSYKDSFQMIIKIHTCNMYSWKDKPYKYTAQDS